jgi:hypothetical protein
MEMEMDANRRNILGMLGLTSAAAVSTEAMATSKGEGWPMYCPALAEDGPEKQNQIATALENLARSIRNRDAVATGVNLVSSVNGTEFLEHEIKITVELPFEQSDVRVPKQIEMAEKALAQARKELDDARAQAKEIVRQARLEAMALQAND